MFERAKEKFNNRIKQAGKWEEFMAHINTKNVVLTPWCQKRDCEEKVKEMSGEESKEMAEKNSELQLTGQAKTLCIPLESEPIKQDEKCFRCGEEAKVRVLWGRTY
jgi:prolyl-tRNA synthetase